MRLNKEQQNKVKEYMNPEGSNYKDCNFFNLLETTEGGSMIEVGYWITYIGCKPKYQKETINIKL